MPNLRHDTRNPYLSEHGEPQLKKSVVAFIDILGYKKLVCDAHKNGQSQQLLSDLHQKLSKSFYRLDGLRDDGTRFFEKVRPNEKDNHKIRTFSDCIVIGFPISEYTSPSYNYRAGMDEFLYMFSGLAFFQLEMVNQDIFVRGAIAVGDLFIDEIFIFGNGLLDSYQTESKQAMYPRIILTESAESMVRSHDKDNGKKLCPIYMREVYKDANGKFFLNYLNSIRIGESDFQFIEELEKHKNVVLKKLENYRTQPDILSKYVWVANYHNLFCDQCYPEEYKIDMTQY